MQVNSCGMSLAISAYCCLNFKQAADYLYSAQSKVSLFKQLGLFLLLFEFKGELELRREFQRDQFQIRPLQKEHSGIILDITKSGQERHFKGKIIIHRFQYQAKTHLQMIVINICNIFMCIYIYI